MVSRKRDRPEDSDGDDSNVSDNEDSSSESHETPKRVRHDMGITSEEIQTEEDLATLKHHQQLEAEQGRERPENAPADGGIVLSVVCENFMCHGHLTCPLGPHMNFIIGHNGSGKSAILTALTLALGGKASATSRGNSMKSFIKEGKDEARITVKLKNEGDGFKTDKYGKVIIIERKFDRDGSSNYTLKSENNKIISRKKDELDDICDYYGLQVDNPMTILTQDAAREFLSTATNAQKYQFFSRGVQLEQLDQDYSLIHQSIKSIEAVLLTKTDAVESLERKLENCRKKVEQFDSHDTLRDSMQTLQYQMAWVQVVEAEEEVARQQAQVDIIREKITQAEKMKDEASEKYDIANREWEVEKERLQEETAKKEPYNDAFKELKIKFDEGKQALMGFQVEERDLKAGISNTRGKIAQIKKKIEAEEQRLKDRDGGANSQLVAGQKEAEVRRQELETERQRVEDRKVAVEDERKAVIDEMRRVQPVRGRKLQDIEEARSRVHRLQQTDQDGLGAFARGTPALLRLIDNERGWRQKPIGPIGRYVTLKDQSWMHIVEKHFGGTLNSFVVTNNSDAEKLKRLMSNAQCSASVCVLAPKPINMEEPGPQYTTILRILDISHELVRLQLIVGHMPEQIILIRDLEEANEVMAVRTARDNISGCYALNHSAPGYGHRVGGQIGASSVTPMNPFSGNSRMKTDRTAHLREAQEDLARVSEELNPMDEDIKRLEAKQRECETVIQDLKRKSSSLQVDIHRQEGRIDELKAKIEQVSTDSALGPLNEELKVVEESLSTYEKQYNEFFDNRTTKNEEQNELAAQMKSAKQDRDLAEKRCTDIDRDVGHADKRRASALESKNNIFRKMGQLQVILDQHVPILDDHIATAKYNETQASAICDRVDIPPGATTHNLDQRLQKLDAEIKAAEASLGGSRDEVIEQFTTLNKEWEEAKAQIKYFDSVISAASRVLRDRRTRWKEFQKHISARARAQFMFMMSERAFKGRLRLEHTERPPELIIEVQPGGEDTGNRGPKTLSGGEKSFSTICLLLSLWEAMGSPIRCLDEFDVFMDAVNRSISVDILIKAAERSIGKQFIMITPQNMSRASTTNAKIFRLTDPDRGTGQTTLELQ